MTTLSFQLKHAFTGPNPYCSAPALVGMLSSDAAIDVAVVETMAQRLCAAYPEWVDRPSADALPLHVPTALAKLMAHWAKGLLNSVRGFVQVADAAPNDAHSAWLWVGFHLPTLTEQALVLAFKTTQSALQPDFPSAELTQQISRLQALCRQQHPDYQARILMQAAAAHDIPWLAFGKGTRLWQFGWGRRSRVFFESSSNRDGLVAGTIAQSKAVSKLILRELGLPTPPDVLVSGIDELPAAAYSIGWPCVVKPLDRGGGKGVTAGIHTLPDLEQAFKLARQYTSGLVMIEHFVPGDDHRLIVIEGQLVAAIRRDPPCVWGDGQHSVGELLASLNQRRSADIVRSNYLRFIAADAVVAAQLARQALTLDSVPKVNQKVLLRSNANLSTGGACTDVLSHIHPEVKALAEMLAVTVGIGTAGLDYLTADIRQSVAHSGGAFIEINTTPGLDAVIAAGGQAVKIGKQVLGSQLGRIPVVALLLPASLCTDLAPRLADMAAAQQWAWLCDSQAGMGKLPLAVGHLAPSERVAALLKHQQTKGLLMVWTDADLYALGAPLDKIDRLVCCQLRLPSAWDTVIDKVAGQKLDAQSLAEALALCQSALCDCRSSS